MKKLVEITSPKHRCEIEVSCPAVFKSDAGTYVIVGRTLNPNDYPALKVRVGADETAVEIAFDLLEEALKVANTQT